MTYLRSLVVFQFIIFFFIYYRESSHRLPYGILYASQLRQREQYFQIIPGTYALADCDGEGRLLNKFQVVQLKQCASGDSEYLCTCGLQDECSSEPTCIHATEAANLWPPPIDGDDADDEQEKPVLVQLSETYLALRYNEKYVVLTQSGKRIKCCTCHSGVTWCNHVQAYQKTALDNGFNPFTVQEESTFHAISQKQIQYPFTKSDRELYDTYESGTHFPSHLVPLASENKTCCHGNHYDIRSPQDQGWIINKKAIIVKKSVHIPCITYFRPTVGDCECQDMYDGREDLLLNLDNNTVYYYGWLADILHDTQETRYPLAAAFRSSNRTRNVCSMDETAQNGHWYNKLRKAYNVFIRLLDLDFPIIYECEECGEDVDTVIMDGIMMGSRKELMPHFQEDELLTKNIPECSIKDRVFVSTVQARKQLAKYAGFVKGKVQQPAKLT